MNLAMKGITREGKAIFGEWVARTRASSRTRNLVIEWLKSINQLELEYVGDVVTQAQFARWITAKSGFRVSESAIGRLERAESNSAPPLEVLAAITLRMKLLQLPDGSYCTLEDAIAVLTEELNPFTGKRKHHSSNGALS